MPDVITIDAIVNLVSSTASAVLTGGGSGSDAGHDDGEGHVHIEPKNNDLMAQMLTTAQRMHWGASVVVGPMFVILGLMGNILSIVIWTRPHMTSSTGRYLTALVSRIPLDSFGA